ncbi:hypothetical protein [Alteribacter natronophilus]|uniref:hypothetical protein n=1 Tax=Alteribacter natronophilus TaxID=2583810 RepID=UPI001AEF14E2|nr:hypothetical protein [Alteribacter natronophilus]
MITVLPAEAMPAESVSQQRRKTTTFFEKSFFKTPCSTGLPENEAVSAFLKMPWCRVDIFNTLSIIISRIKYIKKSRGRN